MSSIELGELQEKFADIIWENEPIGSGELVKRADMEFGWKKSTTYTVLKKLCDKGLFRNVEGVVTSCVSQAEFASEKSSRFVNENFKGSLPSFIAAFSARNKLSESEIDEIQRMIDDYKRQ